MNLDSLRDWLDSEEGQQSIIEFGEKLKRKRERQERYTQYIHDKFGNDIDKFIQKVFDKYNSEEYRDREYSLGREPMEVLYWTLLEYAKEYGVEFTEQEYEDYSCMFTGEMYYLGDWIFEVLHGQGSCVEVYKKDQLKRNSQ
jgi:hypothetical protein